MSTLERQEIVARGPWILFDGQCALCVSGTRWLGPVARRRGFRLEPLESAVGRILDTLGTDEMKVVTREGVVVGGAEAFAYVARFVWWARPLAFLWRYEVCRRVLRRIYRWIADHRHCAGGTCRAGTDALRSSDGSTARENPYTLEL